MEQELALRSLHQALSSFNARSAKLNRMYDKVRGKEGGWVSMRNALKLYQNVKALEGHCDMILASGQRLQRLSAAGDAMDVDTPSAAHDKVLIMGKVGDAYLALAYDQSTDQYTQLPAHDVTFPADQVSMVMHLNTASEEFKVKQPVLALHPSTNRFQPGVVNSTPSRRRKTGDYLIKFPDLAQSVVVECRYVCNLLN